MVSDSSKIEKMIHSDMQGLIPVLKSGANCRKVICDLASNINIFFEVPQIFRFSGEGGHLYTEDLSPRINDYDS